MKSALYTTHHRAGFTLVEIMIGVAIIAIMAAIALPAFQRARKRSQAGRTLEELRVLNDAIDQYAINTGKVAGDPVTFDDVRPYLKPATVLYTTGKDCIGQDYGPNFTVDVYPKVPPLTFLYLQDVATSEFWAPYNP
jgi:prepilin-type N-terminal cleavage/methylation domain-containing protein